MNFQDTKRGKRSLYCRNPNCETNQLGSKKWHKKTLIPIKCLTYPNSKQEPEKQIFYICEICSDHNFENFGKPLTNTPLNLKTYLIPTLKIGLFYQMIESRGPQHCIFCKLNEKVDYDEVSISQNTLKPVYKIKPSVYKLFVKGDPRRDYIGFLCLNCEAIYYDPNFKINWGLQDKRTINPIKPWQEVFEKKQAMDEQYLNFLKEKAVPSQEIERQKAYTWRKFKVEEPPKSEILEIDFLITYHTGGIYEPRSDRISITLENLTIRQAKKAIKLFGSKQQNESMQYYN